MAPGKGGMRHRDPDLISNERYEVEYIHKQFPQHSYEQVHDAINEAKRELHGSEDSQKIMEILRRKLK